MIRALVEFEGDSATLVNAGANPYTKAGSIYTISFPLSRYDEIILKLKFIFSHITRNYAAPLRKASLCSKALIFFFLYFS